MGAWAHLVSVVEKYKLCLVSADYRLAPQTRMPAQEALEQKLLLDGTDISPSAFSIAPSIASGKLLYPLRTSSTARKSINKERVRY